MEIQSINAESRLSNVAAAIGRNPRSWSGWSCLMLNISELDEDMQQECLIWVKSIIDAYLKDVEGRVYFCQDNSIHIFAKGIADGIMHQAGLQVCDLIQGEASAQIGYDLFDLVNDGIFYAQHVLEKFQNHVSISVSESAGLDDLISQRIGAGADKRAINSIQQDQPEIKVLLVEDDPVTRWMVRNALKTHCVFACAPTASKAFSMYETYRPDIVFLDIGLPDKSGRIVLEWIMKNDPGACVVMFSSNDHLDNIAGALEDGASGFIAKPFLKEQLLHYLKSYPSN